MTQETTHRVIFEKIRQEVMSWPGVSSKPHRFGGTEFDFKEKEMGHLHGGVMADLIFPKKIRDEIVNSGRASPHHVLPNSGWLTYYIKGEGDIEKVVELFKLKYGLLKDVS